MKKKFLVSVILMIIALLTICNIVLATDEDYSNLPSSYNLRNDINIKVEDQGQRSWCNVYSYVKMIETYIQRTREINYNLSESYVAYSNAPYFGGEDEKLTSPNIINNSSVDISNIIDKNSLVLESEFPNKDYAFNKSNKEKFDNATVMIKSFRPTFLLKSEEIKQYISTKGAIKIHAYGLDSKAKSQWQNSNGTINCKKNEDNADGGHAVVIIGWDDNYSRNNFNSSNRPKNNGAWLILNSWGTDWGNNGTAWVSYEDEWFNWSIQNYGATGIKDITLRGELNAILDYGVVENSVKARILTDDKIENINGWTCENEYTYTKTFTEAFEPYDIEIISKTDGAKTTVNINIPNDNFKYEHLHQMSIEVGSNKLNLDKQDIIIIIYLVALTLIVIFIIVIWVRKNIYKDKEKNKQEAVDKKVIKDKATKISNSKRLRNRIIIITLILLVLAIILML